MPKNDKDALIKLTFGMTPDDFGGGADGLGDVGPSSGPCGGDGIGGDGLGLGVGGDGHGLGLGYGLCDGKGGEPHDDLDRFDFDDEDDDEQDAADDLRRSSVESVYV